MSDIGQMFDATEETQMAALTISTLEAGYGGGAMAEELGAYHAAPWTYQEGLKTAVIIGGLTTAAEETAYDSANAGIVGLTGFDLLNPAITSAEAQENMAEHLSSSTYQTIQGLQAQLANIMSMYKQNCPCKK